MVEASITRLKNRVDVYESKEELAHADHLPIQRLIKKFETLDADLRQYHYTIMELQQNKADVKEEQAVMDDHDEKVTDVINRLQQLVLKAKRRSFSFNHRQSFQNSP